MKRKMSENTSAMGAGAAFAGLARVVRQGGYLQSIEVTGAGALGGGTSQRDEAQSSIVYVLAGYASLRSELPARPHVASGARMMATDRGVWASGWSTNHSRRYNLTRRPSREAHERASAGLAV